MLDPNTMQRVFILISVFVMAAVSAWGLCWHQTFIWIVCPQALVVMFLRQAQKSYDSLGAVGVPDLAVGVLYFPIVGWLYTQALKKGVLRRVAIRVAIWHAVAIIAAVATVMFRNKVWGF